MKSRYGRKELCVHQWALFYLLKEYLKENPLGDSTDYSGQCFLSMMKNRKPTSAASHTLAHAAELLDLEPRLQKEDGSLSLSFRIGGSKKYVVKELSELVSNSANKRIMVFGTSTSWNVSEENFSDRGKEYLRFIREIIEGEQIRAVRLARNIYDFQTNRMTIKGSIPLFGRNLDDFFELQEPYRLEYTEGYGSDKKTRFLTLEHKQPHISLTLQKIEDERKFFQGVRVSGDVPEIMYGQKTAYFLDEDHLCQMDMEFSERMQPLFSMAEKGHVQLKIGRNHLREFYHSVLPLLGSDVTVIENAPEEIRQYLPPEVQFVFYLDTEQDHAVCRAEALYGTEKGNVIDAVIPHDSKTLFAGDIPRDMEAEKNAAELVLDFFPGISTENAEFCTRDESDIYAVLDEGIGQLSRMGDVQATDRFRRLNLRSNPGFSVGVSVKSRLLDLSVASDQIPQDELLAVLDSYGHKKKFHRLKSGDFLKLDNDGIGILDQLVNSLRLSPEEFEAGKMQIPLYRALYLEKMLEKNEAFYTKRDSRFRALVKDFKAIEDSEFEVPESLQKVLRPYQSAGYRWMKTLAAYGFGGILADEMGLGKTLQTIAVLLSAAEKQEEDPALIIAPASLVYNWTEEIKRFAPMLRVCPVIGSQKERAERIRSCREANVLVTSYDLLKRDIAEYRDLSFSYEILDEAQYIKNHSTAASKAVKVIKSRIRYALTGTPIENRLSELWSIFDYLMPGFLYSYESFRKEFESPIVRDSNAAASDRLKKMIAPFILRRLKRDVLKELPEKLEEVRFAQFESAQRKLYDGQVLKMKKMLDEQDDDSFRKNKIQILAELTRLRQICCDPSLCFEDASSASAKREACMELIQSAMEGEHRMLVFSQFTSMLELLEKDLNTAEILYYKITGSTPKEERVKLVNAFNAGRTPVFLISLKAGGTGLNLTGADVVIHYDPWWNAAVQNQATDRAHRIGQQKVVTVFKLIMKDSVEENILRMQSLKKDLADTVLEGENGGLGKMSREELLELIGN